MSCVRILPEILSNKIAAGEVVERPASVVKELVENALDAQSTRILVEVEKGGRSLIRVSDNGTGMSHDDALLSVERYATSKIADEKDLFSIRTLGFRGEALPSIAAVSRFVMETRPSDRDTGTRLEIAGGTIRNVSEAGVPAGTMVCVKDIFFNTPARRKFMKSAVTEMGHIADTLAGIALGWPGVRFSLHHNGKSAKIWSGVSEPLDRAADILGQDMKKSLCKVEWESPDISLRGWVSGAGITRSTSASVYLYVNGRWVKDRILQHAIFAGYAGRIMKGQFPLAVLFVTVDPDQVDVNVHPAKNEVRFARQKAVHQAVCQAVSEALARAEPALRIGKSQMPAHAGQVPEDNPDSLPASFFSSFADEKANPGSFVPAGSHVSEAALSYREGENFSAPRFQTVEDADFGQENLWEKKAFGDLRIIGQFHGTYILCEAENGLILIDQHAAHERVVFEELKRRAMNQNPIAQKLLMPETVELTFKESALMQTLLPAFLAMGFDIAPFGGNTFAIQSAPSLLSGKAIAPLIAEIMEKMTQIGMNTDADRNRAAEEILMLTACHGAIRAGQSLSPEQMRGLLRQMDECENPSNCPHGRPTWIRWGLHFLEKSFRRVV
ncbi:MAG: DNA mismatch repair endonuclease MutL [Desulfobacterales bacterium]